ncbi:10409_t:CDS:2 [Diversispora eburnea]|uniref:10409_t:CDS:1 n=1 Tax=Diversispora eburnea TaxID=1213867 RepID=A0A9N8YMG5_9GLOM|nr:10409_t:CDS:2 [Diversispora eburnea]
MVTGCMPRIEFQMWIDFGFCSCKVCNDYLGESEERKLSDLYQELIIQKDCQENRIEVCGYKQPIKSVYYLKQYVLSEFLSLELSVNVDYGFMNCRTDEIKKLRNMYKKLFETLQFDPQDLHEACMAGKIFNYIRSILPNEVVNANLLKNPYPLRDY